MYKLLIFVIVLAISVGFYYYYYAGKDGILAGGSYSEAREDFASMRPAETVWTPDMNQKASGQEK